MMSQTCQIKVPAFLQRRDNHTSHVPGQGLSTRAVANAIVHSIYMHLTWVTALFLTTSHFNLVNQAEKVELALFKEMILLPVLSLFFKNLIIWIVHSQEYRTRAPTKGAQYSQHSIYDVISFQW